MKLQASVLKAGGFGIVNIADARIDDEVVPLERWTVECGKAAGLTYKRAGRSLRAEFRLWIAR